MTGCVVQGPGEGSYESLLSCFNHGNLSKGCPLYYLMRDTVIVDVCQLVRPLKCNGMVQHCENFGDTTGDDLTHLQDTTAVI